VTEPADPSQTLTQLIQAAGNADAVRLAALAYTAYQSGSDTFTRQYLTDAWTARWRQHLSQPDGRTPAQRVNRAIPVLTACTALVTVGGPEVKVGDADILQFLADRVYMAEALDRQAPMSNTLPVGEQTRAAAAALVAAGVDAAAAGDGGLGVDAARDSVPRPGDLGGVMTLTVEAEVIKGTPPS
jgi:hypothetical protein